MLPDERVAAGADVVAGDEVVWRTLEPEGEARAVVPGQEVPVTVEVDGGAGRVVAPAIRQ